MRIGRILNGPSASTRTGGDLSEKDLNNRAVGTRIETVIRKRFAPYQILVLYRTLTSDPPKCVGNVIENFRMLRSKGKGLRQDLR